MTHQRVLVVSIDGVAPRFVTPASMPHLCGLARQGAGCFAATTVFPSITLPAHTSMLRGIDPTVHCIHDNRPKPLDDAWPTFLRVARQNGRRTAALLNWTQVNGIVEDDAVDVRYFLNGGYGLDDDRRLAAAAQTLLGERPEVAFAYLVSPDLAGHKHGWGSDSYYDALARSDRALGALVQAAGEDCAVIVTTDHGGHDRDHQQSHPLDMETFVVARSNDIDPLTTWGRASILDVAPTVAAIAGFEPAPAWSGRSLIGSERPITDHLLDRVEAMVEHAYGERVNMRDHALQTAAAAELAGADSSLVAAALLHDVGHLLGDAGKWGFADHAGVGAAALQQVMPVEVVEPIRLHVDAKRYLVATDPAYVGELSEASLHSLAEQGGAFTSAEAAAFIAQPFAIEAVELRRFDDSGKTVGQTVPATEHYRPLIDRVVAAPSVSAQWLRDACTCGTCRDETSGQHLIDIADSAGWTVTGTHTVTNDSAAVHNVEHTPTTPDALTMTYWRGDHALERASDVETVCRQVSEFGIAISADLEPRDGAVLEYAAQLGFVRNTNYGELFDVRAIGDPNNLAYTPLGLPLHTDNPYRDPVPTVQILHCLQPADEGGASRFCDGFAVAEYLRAVHPDHFEILTTTPVDFRFQDATVDLRARHAMIELGVDGAVRAVHVNHRSMVTPSSGPRTDEFYDAYRHFAELLNAADSVLDVMLNAGDVVVFDNRRVLHSRTGFTTRTERHLQGCYIDIDAIHSKARRSLVTG